MKNKLNLSIIIPTMNRYKTLTDTLESIYVGEYLPSQVIIVDQSNKKIYDNKLEEKLKNKFKDLSIEVLRQQQPSLTKARNKGYKKAKNEYIVCCDDDIICQKDTLKNIYDKFESNSSVAMISAWDNKSIYKSKNKLTFYMGSIFGTKNLFKNPGHITKGIFGNYPDFHSGTIEVEWAMGYFFAFRKSLKDKWKIEWDEQLVSYAYPEDLDFSISFNNMCKLNGYKIIMDSDIRVSHIVSQEWRITSYKSTLMFVINREYLSYKHYNTCISRVLTRWANIGEFIKRILRKDAAFDIIKAQIICDKNRKLLKNKIIPKDIFE